MFSQLENFIEVWLPFVLSGILVILVMSLISFYFREKRKQYIKEKIKKEIELSFDEKLFHSLLFTKKDDELLLKEKEIEILKKILKESLSHEERTQEKYK